MKAAASRGWAFQPQVRRLVDFGNRLPKWLILFVGALVYLARRPDAYTRPQFWAEDGFFYEKAITRGLGSLSESYAGYFHTIPRLIALAAASLDPLWAPRIFVGCAVLGALYVASRALSLRSPMPYRLGAALAVVLVPDTGEILANVVNLQWVMAGGLMLLLISSDPGCASQYVHDFLAAVLLGLTGPFSVFLFPLFIIRAWQRGSPCSWAIATTVGVCAFIQGWTIIHAGETVEGSLVDFSDPLRVTGMRITASLLAGNFVPQDYPRLIEIVLGLVALVGVLLLAFRSGDGKSGRVLLSVAFFLLLAAAIYRCRRVLPDLCHAGYGSRYFYPLQLAVIWLLLSTIADSRRWLSKGAAFLVVWILLVNLPRLRETPLENKHWEQFAPLIRSGQGVVVPINPDGWTFTLPKKPK